MYISQSSILPYEVARNNFSILLCLTRHPGKNEAKKIFFNTCQDNTDYQLMTCLYGNVSLLANHHLLISEYQAAVKNKTRQSATESNIGNFHSGSCLYCAKYLKTHRKMKNLERLRLYRLTQLSFTRVSRQQTEKPGHVNQVHQLLLRNVHASKWSELFYLQTSICNAVFSL